MYNYLNLIGQTGISLFPVFFVSAILIFSGCSSSNDFMPEKMDTALNQKIQKNEKDDPDQVIQFLGKCSSSITPEIKDELQSSGISLESIVQNIFTATGTAAEIKKVSLFQFVTSLELVRHMDLK
jgi:hypothetical protein